MTWSKRDGLNVLAVKNDFIDHTSYNQNIKARLALAKVLGARLGGEGIYALANSESLAVVASVPPLNLIIYDDSDEAWYFSTEKSTNINWLSTDTSAGQGALYAVITLIDPEPAGGPAAAGYFGTTTNIGVSFVADHIGNPAPDNSVLIGTGTITSSSFLATFVETNNHEFPPAISSLLWKISTDGDAIQEINADDILTITYDNGILTSSQTDSLNPDQKNWNIGYNTSNTSGLQFIQGQLAVKTKTGGKLSTTSDGLARDTSTDSGTYQFDIKGDYGDILSIKKNNSFSIIGTKAISTENISGIDKEIGLDLNLAANSGLQVSANKLAVLPKPDGKISVGSAGVARSLSSFVLSSTGSDSDAFSEDDTITIQGSDAIVVKSEATNAVNIYLNLDNLTEGGAESGLKVVGSKLSVAIDPKSNIVVSSAGLSVSETTLGTKYGYPATGKYSVGDLHTDKSSATWLCVVAGSGLEAKWEQVSVGLAVRNTGTTGPVLPTASEFETGYRPHMYRIRAFELSGEIKSSVWIWFNYGRGGDYEKGFWMSEDMHELAWSPTSDWTEGNPDNFFDLEEWDYHRNYKLCMRSPYDGFLVERTYVNVLKISGADYSCKSLFYHGSLDKKYYEKIFTTSGKYNVIECQGRAFKTTHETSVRKNLFAMLAVKIPFDNYEQYVGIKSTTRYIIDSDNNLIDEYI